MADQSLYMGWDLSTTQLKGIVIRSDLKLVHQAHADFDKDFGEKYGVEKGVLTHPEAGEIFAPNAMWLEAVDLVLERLQTQGIDFSKVKGISGAGMQHGTVFWNHDAEKLLGGMKGSKPLIEQLQGAFSHPHSPNWQDASTQTQCEAFDAELGSPEELAMVTGSKAHHRFSGPQILRFQQKFPEDYQNTGRISLVSSFLATLFLGKIAPIDIADVCGMNLWHVQKGVWHEQLVDLAAGKGGPEALKQKLGPVCESGGDSFGKISNYYVERYGFNENCEIAPFTGDNPSTILALPLQASDAIVSLGTSTTFLMNTPEYKPDPAYHFTNHPTTPGHYMFMLCYKNGSLARECVRDALNAFNETADHKPKISAAKDKDWTAFNAIALATPPLGMPPGETNASMKLGLFFPRPEIVPQLPAGDWTTFYDPPSEAASGADTNGVAGASAGTLKPTQPSTTPVSAITDTKPTALDAEAWYHPHHTVRATLESQFLSCRLRARNLVTSQSAPQSTGASTNGSGTSVKRPLPPQPRRIHIVGGGAVNPAIARICGEVLGGAEGVYRLDIGGNACALGSAYKAVWAFERKDGESFEELIGSRWREDEFVEKVDVGYREGVYEMYGKAVEGFGAMEELVLEMEERKKRANGKRRPSLSMGSALTRERTGVFGG